VSISVGTATTTSLGSLSGQSASLGIPAATTGSGNVTAQLLATLPGGLPTVQSSTRLPRAIGTSQLTALLFISFTAPPSGVNFTSPPSFTFVFPAGFALASGTQAFVAYYDPTQSAAGWQPLLGPGGISGTTITFGSVARNILFQSNQTYYFVLFTTGAVVGVPTPTPITAAGVPTPTPVATSTPIAAAGAYTCPVQSNQTSIARGGADGSEATRRAAARPARSLAATTGQLAVSYDRATARSTASTIRARESNSGATLVQELDFPSTNRLVHILSVNAAQVASTTAALQTQAGVQSVDPVGRRHRTATVQYFTNDPYFTGFTAAQNSSASNANPSTFEVGPYEESASVPGQWDMHAIGLDYALAYGAANNGSGIVNAGALGSSSVKIAIIDTGADPNHPELSSKIAYQRCFITGPAPMTQSTGTFSTDPDGHGTDVAGIAASGLNNSFGFVGAGGNAVIYAYRVFPTPDDNCANDNNSDNQCSVNTADIASAINDAIAQHVNVISMSLGGGVCGSGPGFASNGDNDPTEGAAVAAAIAAGIVVVAAAGNDGNSPLEAPSCDTGVIAVGASSLADGQPNGANSNGTATRPIEYVASYSDYGSPGAAAKSGSAWGIVAPGGDPNGNGDNDDLHWIEHIWTSTPFQSSPSDKNFLGNCAGDYPLQIGTSDCRTLIAGTSMATPHVAGAVALILSATGGLSSRYQSPSAMKALLCATADDIGDPHEGCGRLNVYRAMATALGDPNLP